MSAEELATLAIILGMPLEVNDYTQRVRGNGAFGSSMEVIREGSFYKVSFTVGSHTPDHCPPRSSGYSTLMAKHMAFGSVPFGENQFWVFGIYVTSDFFDVIKTGRAITGIAGYGGVSLQYLWRLPGAKGVGAFFHYQSTWVEDYSRVGHVLAMNGDPVQLRSRVGLSTVDTEG